jgi:hypothetical protein
MTVASFSARCGSDFWDALWVSRMVRRGGDGPGFHGPAGLMVVARCLMRAASGQAAAKARRMRCDVVALCAHEHSAQPRSIRLSRGTRVRPCVRTHLLRSISGKKTQLGFGPHIGRDKLELKNGTQTHQGIIRKTEERLSIRRVRYANAVSDGERSYVLPSSREALAHPLAQQAEIFAKCWSEWQDLNLRPPRPERGELSSDSRNSSRLPAFVSFCSRCFVPPWRRPELT